MAAAEEAKAGWWQQQAINLGGTNKGINKGSGSSKEGNRSRGKGSRGSSSGLGEIHGSGMRCFQVNISSQNHEFLVALERAEEE